MDKNRVLRPAAIIMAVAIAGVTAACSERKSASAPPPPTVLTSKPAERVVTQYIPATGQASALQQVDLVARVQGYLTAIKYRDGAKARKGDVLFVIEQDQYKISLELAQAALAQQQAELKNAQTELDRQTQLYAKQTASQAARDDAATKRDAAKAAVDQAAAQVQQAELNLSYTEVKAPFAGVVTNHKVDIGGLVGVGGPTTLSTIVQTAPVYVQFSLDEHLVQRIRDIMRERQMTAATTDGIPVEIGLVADKGYPYTGKIDYVSPSIDTATGTLLVRAVAPNQNGAILPGNFLRLRLPLPNPEKALLAPDSALGASQGGRYLLLVNDQDIVEERYVTLGQLTDDGMRVITSGLKGDERIIVGQTQGAIPGVKVNPKAVTNNAASGANAAPGAGRAPAEGKAPAAGQAPGKATGQ